MLSLKQLFTLRNQIKNAYMMDVSSTIKEGIGDDLRAQKESAWKRLLAADNALNDVTKTYHKNPVLNTYIQQNLRELQQKYADQLPPQSEKLINSIDGRKKLQKMLVAILSKEPEFEHNPELAKDYIVKRAKTEWEKAAKQYAQYDPDFEYTMNLQKQDQEDIEDDSDAKMPTNSEASKKIIDIEDIIPLKHYKWPKQITASKIPYGAQKAGQGEIEMGTGPGENWLARLLGAKVQGGNVSFDLVTQDGRKWEVKALDGASSLIRPGVKGLKAYEKSYKMMSDFFDIVKTFTKQCQTSEAFDQLRNETVDASFENVKQFASAINKDEISYEKMIKIYSVVHSLKELRDYIAKQIDFSHDAISEKKYGENRLTVLQSIRVEKLLKKLNGNALSDDEQTDLSAIIEPLYTPAIDDNELLLNAWGEAVDVRNVFSGVNGMFIVSKDMYMMIPAEDFVEHIKFKKVSQGRPRFGVDVFFSVQ